MLEFKRLRLEDIPLIKPYFLACGINTCDYTVGGTFMWRDYFDEYYAIEDETLLFRVAFPGIGTAFTCPLGKNTERMFSLLGEYCENTSTEMIFCMVADEQLPMLLSKYPTMTYEVLPEWADYLYDAGSFESLSGKKLGGHRNHVHQFDRAYPQSEYKQITAEDTAQLVEFVGRIEADSDGTSPTAAEDKLKTLEVLEKYDTYGMCGGVLRVGKEIVGFSVGETIGDTLFVHIEKADTAYNGAYQKTANMFANTFAGTADFINREDDAGDAGLRKSKLSYQPIKLLAKYIVRPV